MVPRRAITSRRSASWSGPGFTSAISLNMSKCPPGVMMLIALTGLSPLWRFIEGVCDPWWDTEEVPRADVEDVISDLDGNDAVKDVEGVVLMDVQVQRRTGAGRKGPTMKSNRPAVFDAVALNRCRVFLGESPWPGSTKR